MNSSIYINRLYTLKILSFFIVLLILGVVELYFFISQNQKDSLKASTEAIKEAESSFKSLLIQFEYETRSLISLVEGKSDENELIEKHLSEKSLFWGTSIFQNNELWVWTGFADLAPTTEMNYNRSLFTSEIEQENNVTFLSGNIAFISEFDSLAYKINTKLRLSQTNILPIGKSQNLRTENILNLNSSYPVHFSFFTDSVQNAFQQKILTTALGDSLGVIYTLTEDQALFEKNSAYILLLVRSFFYLVLAVYFFLFLFQFTSKNNFFSAFLTRILGILLGWIFSFYFLSLPSFQVLVDPFPINNELIRVMILYLIHAVFISIAAFTISNAASVLAGNNSSKFGSHTFAISTGLVFGTFLAFSIQFISSQVFGIFSTSTFTFFDLSIFPSLAQFLFYLAIGLVYFSLSLFTLLGIKACYQFYKSKFVFLFTGLVFGFLLCSFFLSAFELYNLAGFIIFLLLIVSISIFVLLKGEVSNSSSAFRPILFFALISVLAVYVPAFLGDLERKDTQLKQLTSDFKGDDEIIAQNIAFELLLELESRVSGLTLEDLTTRRVFLRNYFNQTVSNLLKEEWSSYSISTQLIDNSGNPLAEYTTNLNAPGWTKTYTVQNLQVPYEVEQIRRNRLRPVVRDVPLEPSLTRYTVYRQAWIPFFKSETDDTRMGWILASVYKERPQYEKPLRAVVAFADNQFKNSTFVVEAYNSSGIYRSSTLGIPLRISSYNTLPNSILNRLNNQDSFYRTKSTNTENVREFFQRNESGEIIRTATFTFGYSNHIFSFLRFYFYLVFSLLLISFISSGFTNLSFFANHAHFKSRLVDRFTLASLFCLAALILAAYQTIGKQNENLVRDDVQTNLAIFTDNILNQRTETDIRRIIDRAINNLAADAMIYQQRRVSESTTPQIFTQNLISDIIPWPVYNSIINEGSEFEFKDYQLGDQLLRIGFKPILLNNRTTIAAIPTFLKAPKFNELLLSTTSYLVGIFAVIFGLFILGANFIAKQLTQPLEELSSGIKTISDGNLDANLPVKSKDEIGSLTLTFNQMVGRLKELQSNLVAAEREAAWKEMAQQVAHEIKNPLTPMKLNLQHLERQLADESIDANELKAKISVVNKNMIEQIESLNRIASDFSNFAKPIKQNFESLDVNEILKMVAELYQHDDGFKVNVELEKGQVFISGVKEELRRVFINLIKNASEALKENGVITLKSVIEDSEVVLNVSDNGVGIPDEDQAYIFVPNFSTKSSGTGLGLAITKKIIEEHNGEISFSSDSKNGTCFEIRLPLKA